MKTFQVAALGATLLLASTASAQGLVGLGDKDDGALVASTAQELPKTAVKVALGAVEGAVGGDLKEIESLGSEAINAVHVVGSLVPDQSVGKLIQRSSQDGINSKGDGINVKDALAPLAALKDELTGSALKTRDDKENIVTDLVGGVVELLGTDGLASPLAQRADKDAGADVLKGLLSTVEGALHLNTERRAEKDDDTDLLKGVLSTVESALHINTERRADKDDDSDLLTGLLTTVESALHINTERRADKKDATDAVTGLLATVEHVLGGAGERRADKDADADVLKGIVSTVESALHLNTERRAEKDIADAVPGLIDTVVNVLGISTQRRADKDATDPVTGLLSTVENALGLSSERRADGGDNVVTDTLEALAGPLGLRAEQNKRDNVEGYHNNSPLYFKSLTDVTEKLVKMVGQGLPNEVPTTTKRIVDDFETAFVKRATDDESSPLTDYEKKVSKAFGKYVTAVKDLLPTLPDAPSLKRDQTVNTNLLTGLAKDFLKDLHARDIVLPPIELFPGAGPKANAFAQDVKKNLTAAYESLHIARSQHQKMAKQRRH